MGHYRNHLSEYRLKSRRFAYMKRKATIQAEHSGKITVSAAWWLVITAIFASLAAISGSLISF